MKSKKDSPNPLPFSKENYVLIAVGIGLLVLGFILMSGGGSDNPEVFSDKIFSFRRLTLAPLVVMGGFGTVLYAILKKPKAE